MVNPYGDGPEQRPESYEEHYERDIDDADVADMLGTNLHERATTGVDRRHWSETEVPGREE